MKRLFPALLMLVLLRPGAFAADTWENQKSTHFIVYYKHAPAAFINKVVAKSEEFYEKIADNMGFTRYNFWLWEHRALIYIHDSQEDYVRDTGSPAWSGGAADARRKLIHTFVGQATFFTDTLPHEMAHIIFREFVNPQGNRAFPGWLDEGVAVYFSGSYSPAADMTVKQACSSGKFIGLENMPSGEARLDNNAAGVFYAEAASIVRFLLIQDNGREKFASLCSHIRDNDGFVPALGSSYGYKDLRQLQLKWLKYLGIENQQ